MPKVKPPKEAPSKEAPPKKPTAVERAPWMLARAAAFTRAVNLGHYIDHLDVSNRGVCTLCGDTLYLLDSSQFRGTNDEYDSAEVVPGWFLVYRQGGCHPKEETPPVQAPGEETPVATTLETSP